jgi:hypothetical protein
VDRQRCRAQLFHQLVEADSARRRELLQTQ